MLPFLGLAALGVLGAAAVSAISDSIEEDRRERAKIDEELERERYERQLRRREEIQTNASKELNARMQALNNEYDKKMRESQERIKTLDEMINKALNT